MSEMLQQPFASTAFESKKPPHGSFWIDAPREGFTALCRGLAFHEEPTERQKRIKASNAAEQQLTA